MKNILYVDDASEDRELMELAFARSAKTLRLKTVAGGELACEYLKGVGEHCDRVRFPLPDLVLLDLKMTDMSGFDVLRWIRNRPETAGLRAAIYSSSFVDSDVEIACQLGAESFISKPSSWARQNEFVRVLEGCFLSDPPDLTLLHALPEYKGCISYGGNLTRPAT